MFLLIKSTVVWATLEVEKWNLFGGYGEYDWIEFHSEVFQHFSRSL